MEKMTQKQFFNEIIVALNGGESKVSTDDMINFIQGRIAVLDNKTANRKPSKTQVENEKFKETILEVLVDGGKTATEVLKSSADFDGLSNQKISALLRQLIAEDKVVKDTEKGKSIFKLAA